MQFLAASLLVATALASPVALEQRHSCPNVGITASRKADIANAFNANKVVPDVVPSIDPTTDFKVFYGTKAMNLGNTFAITETLPEPTYQFDPEPGYNPETTKYTFINADPDAPSPDLPLLRQFLHQITYDVQPSCITGQSPKSQAMYMPLTPLSVATHRYTYLIYRQPPNYIPTPLDPVLAVARAPFNLQEYVDANKLVLVGGNFMREGAANVLP